MDKLGNRENVNIRSGIDVNYAMNDLTNRYAIVGLNSQAYDSAGNTYHCDFMSKTWKVVSETSPTEVVVKRYTEKCEKNIIYKPVYGPMS